MTTENAALLDDDDPDAFAGWEPGRPGDLARLLKMPRRLLALMLFRLAVRAAWSDGSDRLVFTCPRCEDDDVTLADAGDGTPVFTCAGCGWTRPAR